MSFKLKVLTRPLTIRNPEPEPLFTDLVFTQPEEPFVDPGRFAVEAFQTDRQNVDIGGARFEITVE